MTSHDVLISTLTTDLVAVRPRSAAKEYWLLGAVAAIELAIFLSIGVMRPDMGQALGHPFMWWKLGSLAVIAAISAATAIRSFSPTVSPHRGLALAGVVSVLAIAAGGVIAAGAETAGTIAERLSPVHGLICALCITVLSLPVLAMLSILMRRGAPTRLKGSAVAVGIAASTWGAFVFAFCCPVNDPLYVMAWYFVGCAAVTLATRMLLPTGFRL